MEATDILMEEHRVIERVLQALEKGADRLEKGEPVRPAFFLDAADFIAGFADGCHHRKEEGVLFRVMVEQGMPEQGGPIAVMKAEHEEGRRLTRAMREAAQDLENGKEERRRDVIRNARLYVHLLQQHIAKEDGVLFPMAERVIPAGKHGAVEEQFAHLEAEETGEGVHEKYLALAEKLTSEIAS
jgi:hemerythrin-like domain-containing protein